MKSLDFDNWDRGYFDGLQTALEAIDEQLDGLWRSEHMEILQQGLFVAHTEINGLLDDMAKQKANHES
jgi:hypothetical protein